METKLFTSNIYGVNGLIHICMFLNKVEHGNSEQKTHKFSTVLVHVLSTKNY